MDCADNLEIKQHLHCDSCGKNCDMDKFVTGNLMSAFILKWYCKNCQSKDNKVLYYCPFGCSDKNGCKRWTSIKWFVQHLKRFHYDSVKVLDLIGMKMCMDVDCTEVIDTSVLYCQTHHQINSINDDYQQTVFGKCKMDHAK